LKRVLCTVTNDLNFDQRMIRICTSLQKSGLEVELVGRYLPESNVLNKQPFAQKRLRCRFHRGPLFYLEYNLRLIRYFIQVRPDVINTIDLDTGFAAWVYRKLTKFRWIFDAHEHFTEVPEVTNRFVIKQIWTLVERMVFGGADRFYTVSHSISELYEKKYKKKVEVIRNVPFLRSTSVVKPQSELSEKVTIIYQGALNQGRCVDLYIKAMHHIDAQLWLVGEGDLGAELRKLVLAEKLSDKVVFKGKVDPEELRQLTQTARMGLNVLENIGLSYYYSLSNKCFDYIQAHLPSISSNFPEYERLNQEHETMLLLEPNLKEITDGINRLLHDADLYERLKYNCKPAAETWNWKNEEIKLLAVYD